MNISTLSTATNDATATPLLPTTLGANVTLPSARENLICAMITIFTSGGGLLLNAVVSYVFYVTQNSSFGILIFTLAIGDCGVLLVFAGWIFPQTLLQNPVGFWDWKMGQASIFFWYVSLYTTGIIAVNRFSAVSTGAKYQILFSKKRTKIYVSFVWVATCLHSIPYFLPTCNFFFEPPTYIFRYEASPLAIFVGRYPDFGLSMVVVFVVFVFNMLTLGQLVRKKAIGKVGAEAAAQAEKEKRSREIRFFLQSLINALVFEIMLLFFHVFSHFFYENWGLYFSTTFMWQFSHSTNGILILIFNKSIRKKMFLLVTYREWRDLGTNSMAWSKSALAKPIPSASATASRY